MSWRRMLLLAAAWIGLWTVALGQGLPDKAASRARLFPLERVKLQDSCLLKVREQTRDYLLSLDSGRLLRNYQVNAGFPTDAEPLSGHEAPDAGFRGHYTGHYLTACAMMYASTGDERLKGKADAIVAAMAQCQQANGYLAALPEARFDELETGKKAGCVWYAEHKILAGLLDMYLDCGNRQAYEMAQKLGDWVVARTARLDHETMQRVLATEFGGMGEVMANLSAVTGKDQYLEAAKRFDHDEVFQPAARGEDALTGLHANCQIPKFVAAARLYELTGMEFYRDAATSFWRQVALHRSYAAGGHSLREHFTTPPDVLAGTLECQAQETCNTYNMLRLTEHLFAWKPNALYGDFYERALLNHILATPHPKTGMPLYFLGLQSGQWKCVFERNQSFWCCAGTGLENFAKLQRGIYYQGAGELWVNLFFASELDWRERDVTVRQTTRFPEEGGTRLTVRMKQPVSFKLHIRIPYWAEGASITVNGQPQSKTLKPATYATIVRTWNDGDQVRVQLPMRLHLQPLPDDAKKVAILYGPVVLAGELGGDGLEMDLIHFAPHNGEPLFQSHPFTDANKLALVDTTARPEDWLEPVAGKPLTFRTHGVGRPRDFTLSPFYRLFDQRYAVYWDLLTDAQWRQREAAITARQRHEAELAGRTIDMVGIGDQESETKHHLAGERTTSGTLARRSWRHATAGGWFAYTLKTAGSTRLELLCEYWGSDGGARNFDILVDGHRIATQSLQRTRPNSFFDVRYPLPPEAIQGRSTVTIRFQAHANCTVGGLFDLRILKP